MRKSSRLSLNAERRRLDSLWQQHIADLERWRRSVRPRLLRLFAERATTGDLVVTQDIPLAARVLANGADAVDPRGERFTADTIAERLFMRNFMDELRGAGVQTGGPAAFNARDRQAFANQLDRWLAARR